MAKRTSKAAVLAATKAEFVAEALGAGRARMDEILRGFSGQRGVEAAAQMSDEAVASVLWSLHGMALSLAK